MNSGKTVDNCVAEFQTVLFNLFLSLVISFTVSKIDLLSWTFTAIIRLPKSDAQNAYTRDKRTEPFSTNPSLALPSLALPCLVLLRVALPHYTSFRLASPHLATLRLEFMLFLYRNILLPKQWNFIKFIPNEIELLKLFLSNWTF